MVILLIEKYKLLFVFKLLLYNYYTKYGNIELPFNNTQPSKTIIKTFFSICFFDYMLNIIPHTVNGTMIDYKLINEYVGLTIIGRYWPQSNYKFVNELDYINTMKSVDYQTDMTEISQKSLFNDLIADYIGYGLITQTKNNYVIDTRYLQQFEIREGYSKLDIIVYLDENMEFDYCKINDLERKNDFAIRECITAIYTIITIEMHLFRIHLFVSDKFNSLLNTIDKTNPFYRILLPFTNNQYHPNECASIGLLGETGACIMFNFTRNGLVQYYEYTKQKLNIRDFLLPKQFHGKSAIHKHQHLWFECIHNFVSDFLSIQISLDCDAIIELLNKNYDGIYDETKSKLENMVDICSMFLFSNIIHECYSNSNISKLSMNPFTLSTTWKQNDSSNLSDKINNLGEQTLVNFIAYATSLEAIRMDDERWVNMCCANPDEKVIWQKFRTAISQLDIPENAILHPKNISSSISY